MGIFAAANSAAKSLRSLSRTMPTSYAVRSRARASATSWPSAPARARSLMTRTTRVLRVTGVARSAWGSRDRRWRALAGGPRLLTVPELEDDDGEQLARVVASAGEVRRDQGLDRRRTEEAAGPHERGRAGFEQQV